MPTPRKGARLWLRPARRNRNGKIIRKATWIILDYGGSGKRHHSTGCLESEVELAERKLAEYFASKYRAPRKERELEEIDVADVLSVYIDDCGDRQRSRGTAPAKRFNGRMMRLNDFWGGKMLSEVNGNACREYAKWRGNRGGARRDLEDLNAAINHHAKEGLHRSMVRVTLPPRGKPRDRWLRRDEAAKLIWTCWRQSELQLRHRGPEKGQKLPTSKYPLRHLARFILIALYTGTRAASIAKASPTQGEGRSFVDLEAGIFYRLPEGDTPSKKRQPPAPIPTRLLGHMRRWHRKGIVRDHFVEWQGTPIASVKTALNTATRLAGIPGRVTPHTFRHTAATWGMQAGVNIWRLAGFLGMTVETLERVYGHHHPDYMADAAEAIAQKPKRRKGASVIALEGVKQQRSVGRSVGQG
jgi:integrase